MAGNEASTGKSYLDSAIAAGQSALGSITGNPADKHQAADTKSQASNEKDLSHTVSKVGPFAATPQGGVSTDDPSRAQGSYNQTIGSAKESLGGLLGSEELKKEGRQQNAEGKGQEAEGQLKDYGSGVGERLKGGAESTFKGLVGDRKGEDEARLRHDDGKAQQRSAEHDIIKQNQ
ncbi:hypothetical protein MMC29_004982 [Sticta canariensis]|nr:hypothetical protein [Sticta canariensis]